MSAMMKKQMDELDVPPVDEFLDMITAGGGEIYACKMAADMFKLTRITSYNVCYTKLLRLPGTGYLQAG